jgi:hypothetical protein
VASQGASPLAWIFSRKDRTMKLLKRLVKLDDDGYVEKSVEMGSLKDTQGTVTHNRQKVVVEYAGKAEGGPLTFREVKPTQEQTWLL